MSRSAAATWHVLLDGNARFMSGTSVHPHQSKERVAELVAGQSPSVAIIGCADSRVCPEIVFDRGLGDIFTVRSAGNTVDRAVLGSAEYAVATLGVQLLLVAGHTECGALGAACSVANGGDMPGGYINGVVEQILPTVLAGQHEGLKEPNEMIGNHVIAMMNTIHEQSAIIRTALRDGSLTLGAVVYHMATGGFELVGVQGSGAEDMLSRRQVHND